MNKNVLISIVISTKGKEWPVIAETLHSLASSGFKGFEIILVDQNHDGGFSSRIRGDDKYKNIVYLRSSETGLSKGRNTGIAHARGQWLLFFDDDAIMPADILGRVAAELQARMDTPLIFYGNVLTLETKKSYLKRAITRGSNINLFNFDSVCSVALLMNRRIFDEIGLFDETLGAGVTFGAGEESDIILRALKKRIEIRPLRNFTVYHPSADAISPEKRRSYGMGIGALYRKHILSSVRCFLALGVKCSLEMLLRIFLVLINSHSGRCRKYHSFYLRGYIKGFFRYYQHAG